MDEILEKIKQAGFAQVSDEMIFAVLGLEMPFEDFQKAMLDKNSDFSKAYHNGKMQFAFKVQLELAKKASVGDIAAINKLEDIVRKNKIKRN